MSLRPFARRLAGGQRGSVLFLLKDKTFRSLYYHKDIQMVLCRCGWITAIANGCCVSIPSSHSLTNRLKSRTPRAECKHIADMSW